MESRYVYESVRPDEDEVEWIMKWGYTSRDEYMWNMKNTENTEMDKEWRMKHEEEDS